MAKKKQKEEHICPNCGGKSWVTTTKGARCDNCGHLEGSELFDTGSNNNPKVYMN
jgi:ribosomal protein L37E